MPSTALSQLEAPSRNDYTPSQIEELLIRDSVNSPGALSALFNLQQQRKQGNQQFLNERGQYNDLLRTMAQKQMESEANTENLKTRADLTKTFLDTVGDIGAQQLLPGVSEDLLGQVFGNPGVTGLVQSDANRERVLEQAGQALTNIKTGAEAGYLPTGQDIPGVSGLLPVEPLPVQVARQKAEVQPTEVTDKTETIVDPVTGKPKFGFATRTTTTKGAQKGDEPENPNVREEDDSYLQNNGEVEVQPETMGNLKINGQVMSGKQSVVEINGKQYWKFIPDDNKDMPMYYELNEQGKPTRQVDPNA